ncbi:MAG: flagellar biosynthetic protein FliR [Anaerolineae bacterium]|nr:flagellar biosynthetic protein FliR [Anaerolineae bacterium]MDW8099691.1 flagellar biosynthetic protein FliR [Anaerolineae bacterium]
MDLHLSGAIAEQGVLTFVRVLTALATGPVFGHRAVIAPVKIGLAMALTYATLVANPPVASSSDGLTFLIAVGAEVLIGALIGFVSMLAFHALEMAGGIISMEMGLSFPVLINPVLPSQGGLIEQFYVLLATLIFFAIRGHHALLVALGRTLEVAPPGSLVMDAITAERLIRFSEAVFVSALQIALPVLATLLLTDLALAMINRVIPRAPVFVLGMPLKVAAGLAALIIAWPSMMPVVEQVIFQAARNVLLAVR